eukprot:gene18871-24658_t
MGVQSSKQQFSEIIQILLKKQIETTNHDFWDELWKTTLPIDELFDVITPNEVRKIIKEQPLNMKILFTQAVAQLYQVVETPYPVYFEQALNCVRILTRVGPFLLEQNNSVYNEVDLKFINDLLWTKQKSESKETNSKESDKSIENAKSNDSSVIITDESKSEEIKTDQKVEEKAIAESKESQSVDPEPLAVILVNTLFHLLFLPDFTIDDPNIEFTEKDVDTKEFKTALMWAPGVGSIEKSVVTSTAYDQNRVDVLRLMVSLFSDALYQHPESFDSCGSLWLEIATSVDIPYAEIVFNSLINTVLGYDPIGWGLPYGNLVATDTAKQLMETAIQVLIILLDYGHPIKHLSVDNNPVHSQGITYVHSTDVEAQGFNVFRRILGSIEQPDQLNFVFRGFSRLLNNVHQSESSYLPYSVTRISIEQELLILLWKCLEEIPKFMSFVLRNCDVNELVEPICYFMIEGERNFGVSLNKSYQLQLPIDIPLFSGNHTDLLVIVLHKMIVSGLDKLSSLYNCFLTIICNVSPYCKTLCTVAAVKLVNLFQLFTSPKFLYGAEGNHVYVSMILESLNNIIQYQYEGNVNVIYAIIRRKEIFESLANLTLPDAIKGAVDIAEKRATQRKNTKKLIKHRNSDNKQSNQPDDNINTSNSNISLDSTISSNRDDSEENVVVEPTPTEMISTTSVERTVTDAGDIEEKQAAPATPSNKTSSTTIINESPTTNNTVTASKAPLRFVPNQIWLDAVKSELPMNTITRLLKHLVPQIEDLAVRNGGMIDELQVMDFIRQTTMVGLLPVPHPIVIRKYQPNKYTCLWFTVFQWGVIFMHNQMVPLFDSSTIKLFIVQTV